MGISRSIHRYHSVLGGCIEKAKKGTCLSGDGGRVKGRRYGLISMLNSNRRYDKEMLESINLNPDDVSADLKKVAARYEDVKTDNETASLAAVDIQSRVKVPCYENNPVVFLKGKVRITD